eukprot:jgi/Tetstr1/420952/TSEL_012012.t1
MLASWPPSHDTERPSPPLVAGLADSFRGDESGGEGSGRGDGGGDGVPVHPAAGPAFRPDPVRTEQRRDGPTEQLPGAFDVEPGSQAVVAGVSNSTDTQHGQGTHMFRPQSQPVLDLQWGVDRQPPAADFRSADAERPVHTPVLAFGPGSAISEASTAEEAASPPSTPAVENTSRSSDKRLPFSGGITERSDTPANYTPRSRLAMDNQAQSQHTASQDKGGGAGDDACVTLDDFVPHPIPNGMSSALSGFGDSFQPNDEWHIVASSDRSVSATGSHLSGTGLLRAVRNSDAADGAREDGDFVSTAVLGRDYGDPTGGLKWDMVKSAIRKGHPAVRPKPAWTISKSMKERSTRGALQRVGSINKPAAGLVRRQKTTWERLTSIFRKKPAKTALKQSRDLTELAANETVRPRLVKFVVPKKDTVKRVTISYCGIKIPGVRPGSVFHTRWSHVMVLPMTYEAWAIPFRWAVTSPDILWQTLLDAAIDCWFLLDMGVQLCTGVPVSALETAFDKKTIVSTFVRRKLFLYYMPAAMLYVMNFSGAPIWAWWVASGLRLPRMYALWNYFELMGMKLDVNAWALQMTKLVLIIFLCFHWFGCVWYLLARVQDFNDGTWVTRLANALLTFYDPETAGLGSTYLLILFRGGNGMTNFGYDTERPNNPAEVVWCMFTIIFQVFLAAYVLGTLFHHLVAKDEALEAYRRRISRVQQFMNDRHLPNHLKQRVVQYIDFTYIKSKDTYSDDIGLPRTLELRVASCQYRAVIETCSVPGAPLRGCIEQFINTLLVSVHEAYLMPGEEFIADGDIGRELGFVASGVLDIIYKDNIQGEAVLRSVYGHDGGGDMPTMVGEIAFFLNTHQPYKVACRSTKDATVLGQPLAGWTSDGRDDDELFAELRDMVVKAVQNHLDDLQNQFTYAVNMGEVDNVKTLIRKGVDVDTSNYDNSSMMHLAALSGNVKVLETLLEEGADKDIADRWGKTPLHKAVDSGNVQALTVLSQHGASLKVADPAGALCSAADKEDTVQLARLVDNGIDPNSGDYDLRTAMHLAAASGAQKSIEYLLANGGNPNAEDRWGGLPLNDAVKNGHHMVMMIIKKYGGQLSKDGSSNASGSQLCDAAAADDVHMLQLLKDAEVDLNLKDYDSRYALHLAASKGRLRAISYLISICADPNVKDRWDNTPVEDALKNGHYQEMLRTVSLEEVREQLKLNIEKGEGKPANEIDDNRILAQRRTTFTALQLMATARRVWADIRERQTATCDRIGSLTDALWEHTKVLAAEMANPNRKNAAPENPRWEDQYHELKRAMGMSMGRRGTMAADIAEDLLALYDELDELAHDSVSRAPTSTATAPGNEDALEVVANMAKAFQKDIVTKLSVLQDGYDEFLDAFYRKSRNEEVMGLVELRRLLEGFGCAVTPSDLHNILAEAKEGSGEHAEEHEGVSSKGLWAFSDTFWGLVLGAHPDKAGQTQANDADNANSSDAQQMVIIIMGREAAVQAFEDLSGDDGSINVADLREAGKSVGEFGAPVFKKLFPQRHLQTEASIKRHDFMLFIVDYLDPTDDDGAVAEIVEEDEAEPLLAASRGVFAFQNPLRAALVSAVAYVRAVRVPLPKKRMIRMLLDRRALVRYEAAFRGVAGDLRKPLKRQNVRGFLMDVLPNAIVKEAFVQGWVQAVAGQPDSNVSWENVAEWITSQTLDADEEGASSGKESGETTLLGRLVIAPSNRALKIWDTLTRICATYQFVIVPLQIASPQVQQSVNIYYLNLATDAIFIADIIVCFLRAYVDGALLVTDLILRIHLVYTWQREKLRSVEGQNFKNSAIRLICLLAVVTHLLASVFLYMGENMRGGWLDRGYDYGASRAAPVPDQYLLCIFYVLATLSSEGNVGELVPENMLEMVFCMVLMLINMTLFVYILGEISSLVMKMDDEVAESRNKQAKVENYIKSKKNVTDDLAIDIRGHINASNQQGSDIEIGEVYALMSHSLKVAVASCVCRDRLDEVTFFSGCNPAFLDSLSVLLSEVAFSKDDIVFRQNEVAEDMLIILTGSIERRIEMEDDDPVVDGRCGPSECVGELSFFFGMRHVNTAVVVAPTQCLKLVKEDFNQILKMYPEEEDKITHNALNAYNKAWNRAGSAKSGASGKSAKSVQETMDELMGGTLKHTISVLKRRRHTAAVEKAIKFASRGEVARMAAILDKGISVNAANHDGRTCLHVAACEGQVEVVERLLDMGADLSAMDNHGNRPMNDAVRHKQDAVTEILRARGSVLKMDECEAAVIMCQAAYENDLATLKRYVENGIPSNAADYDGRTALHLAACEGNLDIINYLLEQEGTDTNCVDAMGNTALEDAIRHGQRGAQKALREKGATLQGHAVRMCEAAAKGDIDTIRVLIENGVDPNEADYDGRTCLHLAACEQQLGVIHFLLNCHKDTNLPFAKKVEVNPVDDTGGTPLEDAVRHGLHVVEMLLRQHGGVCSDNPEALEGARRRQAQVTSEKRNRSVEKVVADLVARSSEVRTAERMERYLGQLMEVDSGPARRRWSPW